MLEIDVHKRLKNLDLSTKLNVAEGEVMMLVGENGCGKTTLLNMIAGLTTPDAGEIALSGWILFDSESKIDIPPDSRNVGYVFQNYALFPHLSVYENVAFGLRTRNLSKDEIESRVKDQLEAAGLWELRSAKALKISGGEKQRVALARALVIEPRLLLLDEPFAAMDIKKQSAMRRELKSIVTDHRIPSIIVTHDMKDITGIGDRVCLLENGKIASEGKADEFLAKKHESSSHFPDDLGIESDGNALETS
jgi:molybdate transport system ATP-binding protein